MPEDVRYMDKFLKTVTNSAVVVQVGREVI